MPGPMENNPQMVAEFGQGGVVVETGTTQMVGPFYAIQILEAATFSEWTEEGDSGDAMTGFSMDPQIIFGNITTCTPSAGKVRGYKK